MAITELTAQTFERTVLDNDIVLVDFWAAWWDCAGQFAPDLRGGVRGRRQRGNRVRQGRHGGRAGPRRRGQHHLDPDADGLQGGRARLLQPGALPQSALQNVIEQVKALDMGLVKEQLAQETASKGGIA